MFSWCFIDLRSTADMSQAQPDAGASGKLGDKAGADRKST